MEQELYSIRDFIYWLEKYQDDPSEKRFTEGQIAALIAQAMIDFFPHSGIAF